MITWPIAHLIFIVNSSLPGVLKSWTSVQYSKIKSVHVAGLYFIFIHTIISHYIILIYRTPLHLACAKGHAKIVQELLEWKAKINVGDNDACTPLIKVNIWSKFTAYMCFFFQYIN